jgi:GT2 family glycosyltransferase
MNRLLHGHPEKLLQLRRFAWQALKQSPRQTLYRLKRIKDRLFFTSYYTAWCKRYDTTPSERNAMVNWADALENPPLIAVLMPVFNPKPEWLEAAIQSVRAQHYPHWQLCIADDCSTDPQIRPMLEAAVASDPRIRVVFREKNGHICACSNSALELVDAPWIALLDQDDLLPEDALTWTAQAIRKNRQARLFYSDEDKLDKNGQRFGPYFKCDWNAVLMEGQNMFSHLGIYSTDLIREVGGFREGLEGSQDYDLALRCSERINESQIVHIPRILYHWRVHDNSTSSNETVKPYAQKAMRQALIEHSSRCCQAVSHLHQLPQGQRLELRILGAKPTVTAIIPTRNQLKILKPCLESLLYKTDYPKLDILVVDNGSNDPSTISYLRDMDHRGLIRTLRDERPFNYSAHNNLAVQHTTSELICLINNDIEAIEGGWLREMVAQIQRPNVAAVGAKLLYPDRCLQHAGVFLGIGGIAAHGHRGLDGNARGYFGRATLAQELSAITAACMLVRRITWNQLGGLDEEHLPVAFNDVDFCLRLRKAGFRIIYTPFAVLIHHESFSRGSDLTTEKIDRFKREQAWMKQRWGDLLTQDPFYNPNLTLEDTDFLLAWPPRIDRWPLQEPHAAPAHDTPLPEQKVP